MSDYLFDKQGEPDPDIGRLENLLQPFAYRGLAPQSSQRNRRHLGLATVGLLAISVLLALLIVRPWHATQPRDAMMVTNTTPASWAVTVRGGAANVEGRELFGEARLPVGAWLETGSSRVQLRVVEIGTVDLEPGTRARIVESGPRRHALRLERGRLAAKVDAPPRLFAVETPRAVVTDLGCAFELVVDDSGRMRLTVTSGKVAVADGAAAEVVVPAGAQWELGERGQGAPQAVDASPPAATEPAEPPAPKRRHIKRAPSKSPGVPKSKKTSPQVSVTPHAEPARKKEPDVRIKHDPLKELERSVE
jgi:ferric-dicitrate binding protein FerR (iron transport regulator)